MSKSSDHADDENPVWTREMFRRARPASEVLPGFIGETATAELMVRRTGRVATNDKRSVRSVRLPAEVIEAYEAMGTDWRQLVERTLRDHMPGRK